ANSQEKELVTWSNFKKLDEQNMHLLFTSENGVIDLVKKYHRNSAYEIFLKGNLLLNPTPKLLFNAVGIIRLIEDNDEGTKRSIFEYLLNKTEVTGQNGQVFPPEYLVELMISIIQPNEKDWMLDLSAGNGSLLVKSIKYISKINPEYSGNRINNFDPNRFVGIESDFTNLRIGGMNMILHGITNPELKPLNASSPLSSITTEQPTVFVANLVFGTGENKTGAEGNLVRDATRKEIFNLNFILKNSKPGTRAVVIVPDSILYNIGPEIMAARQEIIDNFKLEAVISINDKTDLRFFGTSILIFSKEVSTITDKVWFYEMENREKRSKENADSKNGLTNNAKDTSEQVIETHDIIRQFRNRDSREGNKFHDFFHINADVIRSRNYNLSYNEYILFMNKGIPDNSLESGSIEKRIGINKIKNQHLFPAAEKISVPKKSYAKRIIIISIISILIIGGGYWAYLFFDLNKFFITPKSSTAASVKKIDSATDSTVGNTSSLSTPDSIINADNNKEGNRSENVTNIKYTVVIPKAYFYSSPDSNSRRDLYINNLVHATLTPEKEQNGFVYVVYINSKGQSTRGWLNKKDLKLLP
ncbi:MAG TPA: N-6 DNA methylase, partial [Hanamia sp.]|nr:N-6 DNA methylase [Hanamia sp.]